ncbi:MAG: hypothetical protein LBS15_02620 [Endomicrobium sp.]|nr:hypothetical protein [Endomicrobium sp.]
MRRLLLMFLVCCLVFAGCGSNGLFNFGKRGEKKPHLDGIQKSGEVNTQNQGNNNDQGSQK